MRLFLHRGWVCVQCNAGDAAQVHIKVGESDWMPAFRDTIDGMRVAMVRSGSSLTTRTVSIRIDGQETVAGKI